MRWLSDYEALANTLGGDLVAGTRKEGTRLLVYDEVSTDEARVGFICK